MKSILLVGLGNFGNLVARQIHEIGHQVMAIDKQESRIDAVLSYVHVAQIGDSCDENFLNTLGVSDFDCCVCAIGDDFQSSLETTSLLKISVSNEDAELAKNLAKELGAKYVVARACRDRHKKFLLRNGADEAVYPERQLANWTAIRVSSEHIFDYIELSEEYAIFEVSIPDMWIGKTIGQLDIRKKYSINIMGIKTDGKIDFMIGPDYTLLQGQTMMVLGNYKDVQKCFHI